MKAHPYAHRHRGAPARCLIIAALVFAGWSGPSRAADTTVAVVVAGVKSAEARTLAKRLRAAVGNIPGHRPLSAKKTRKALKAVAREFSCSPTQDACVGRLAARVPADLFVVARVVTEGLGLRSYDATTGTHLATALMPLTAATADDDAALLDLVARVVTPELTLGTLVVSTHDAATVRVNDRPGEPGPIARFEGVPVGAAHVMVSAEDRSAELEVKITPGTVTEVELMPPAPPAPPPAPTREGSVLNNLSIGGAVLGGLGLIVALGGAVGAVGLDVLLVMPGETVPPSLRSPLWFMEVAFALAATAGVVTLLGGAATAGAGVALGVME